MKQALPSSVLSNAAATPRPSACPGLLRIVAARDGGICRIRLPGGELTAAQAAALAAASERHASGVIELTNRANLQVRGVRSAHEAALIAALIEAGLGPGGSAQASLQVSATPDVSSASLAAADDVRNVMISPVAGRDPFALFDTRSLCASLLALLQSEARFAALSPKFALLVDGGERLARLDHPHDVWLAASQAQDGVRFVAGLAGCPPVDGTRTTPAATSDNRAGTHALRPCTSVDDPVHGIAPYPRGSAALASVLPSQVPALVRALLHTFLDLAAADATRMRHLLVSHGVDTVLQHAQRYVDFPLARDPSLENWQRAAPADDSLRFGAHPQRAIGMAYVGAQPPLGRLDAATLRRLAELARERGNATLRITPWQSLLLPDVATRNVAVALDELNALGLACDPAQPFARLIACTGSSGCAKGLADTKADAQELAEHLPANLEVHLSGCTRSCAAAHCSPYTLLAVSPGVYDLYRRDGQPGFGERVAQRLTIGKAASLLDDLARSAPDA